MPYIQVDVDALDEFDAVATMTGLSFGDVCGGLLRLWQWCWRKKTAYVARERLAAFFKGDVDAVAQALVVCEFLDRPSDRPDYHVRGAEKRLGVHQARSEAGKAHLRNLRQYREAPPSPAPGNPEVEPEVTRPGDPVDNPEATRNKTPALTPSSQHPTPIKEEAATTAPPGLVEPPDTAPDTWGPEDFWRWAQGKRQKAHLAPERPVRIEALNTWWAAMRRLVKDVRAVQEGFYRFGEDKYWQAQAPPLPFRAFMKHWENFVRLEERHVGT